VDHVGPIRVAIVDDHPVVVRARSRCSARNRASSWWSGGVSLRGGALLDPAAVDVLLLDIRLGTDSGLALLGDGSPRPASSY